MKKEKLFYTVLTIVLFIPGAVLFWELIHGLCHMIGSLVCKDTAQVVKQVTRMAPVYFCALVLTYLQVFVHAAFVAYNHRNRARIWKKNGIATIVLGAAETILVAVLLITGLYSRPIEGGIYPLFPLDMLILGVLIILFGIFSIKYGDDIRWRGTKLELFSNGINPFAHIARVLSYIVTMCAFAACVLCGFAVDWTHGYIFFNVMLCLMYFMPVLMAFFYRFVYFNLPANKRTKMQIRSAVTFLALNVVILGVYLLSVQLQSEAPNQNAFAVLPVEFTASFNAFPFFYGLNNIAAPLAALIRGLIKKKNVK